MLKGLVAITGVLSVGLLILPLMPTVEVASEGWWATLGRFHPLLVHFPIVLIVLPLLVEGAARVLKRSELRAILPLLWTLAVLSSLAAVGAGYLLYASGDYAGDLVQRHLWGGIAVAVATLITATLYASPSRRTAYAVALVLTNGVLVVTSHLGGTLTHGEGFLTEALPVRGDEALALAEKPPEEWRVYTDLLVPIFGTRCMSCHNPHKTRGGFVMTSFAALQQGGDSEAPVLTPGDPEASELYRRVTLPADHDDHMPPSGKPSLKADEIALLRWWINHGADPEQPLGEQARDPDIQRLTQALLPDLLRTQRRQLRDRAERAELHRELAGFAEAHGLVVRLDPETDSTTFTLSMQVPPLSVTDETLADLRVYGEAFSRISLVSSDITDDGLYHLGQMPNLQALVLQKTGVDGSGLAHLQALSQLETLNLSHTALNDTTILHLLRLPALEQVHLYNTRVSRTMLDALQAQRPEVQLSQTEGPLF